MVQMIKSGRTKGQIKGKLTIKWEGDQKMRPKNISFFGLQKRAHTSWDRRREEEEEEAEEEEEGGAKKGKELCMELYGTMVLYGIMCILDFGRDFYGFQN